MLCDNGGSQGHKDGGGEGGVRDVPSLRSIGYVRSGIKAIDDVGCGCRTMSLPRSNTTSALQSIQVSIQVYQVSQQRSQSLRGLFRDPNMAVQGNVLMCAKLGRSRNATRAWCNTYGYWIRVVLWGASCHSCPAQHHAPWRPDSSRWIRFCEAIANVKH